LRTDSGSGRSDVIAAFGELAASIAAGADRDAILRGITRSVRKLVRSDVAAILTHDDGHGWQTIAASGRRELGSRPLGPLLFIEVTIAESAGWLYAGRAYGAEPFGRDDHEVVRTFAAHASLAFESERQRRHHAALDRVAEQWRLASELQTLAGGQIFAASVRLSGVVSEITQPRTRERVIEAIDDLDQSIKVLRQIAFGLVERARSPLADGALDDGRRR
jgi:GAF domain-containing protein